MLKRSSILLAATVFAASPAHAHDDAVIMAEAVRTNQAICSDSAAYADDTLVLRKGWREITRSSHWTRGYPEGASVPDFARDWAEKFNPENELNTYFRTSRDKVIFLSLGTREMDGRKEYLCSTYVFGLRNQEDLRFADAFVDIGVGPTTSQMVPKTRFGAGRHWQVGSREDAASITTGFFKNENYSEDTEADAAEDGFRVTSYNLPNALKQ